MNNLFTINAKKVNKNKIKLNPKIIHFFSLSALKLKINNTIATIKTDGPK